MKRLEMLLAVHHHLCKAAKLPEGPRPHTISGHLEKVQKLIMEEVDKADQTPAPNPTKPNDDIPF